jgi:hypothetical protein
LFSLRPKFHEKYEDAPKTRGKACIYEKPCISLFAHNFVHNGLSSHKVIFVRHAQYVKDGFPNIFSGGHRKKLLAQSHACIS